MCSPVEHRIDLCYILNFPYLECTTQLPIPHDITSKAHTNAFLLHLKAEKEACAISFTLKKNTSQKIDRAIRFRQMTAQIKRAHKTQQRQILSM